MVLLKIVGLVLVIFGFWFVRYFPDYYQKKGMTKTGILIGLLIFFVGAVLIAAG